MIYIQNYIQITYILHTDYIQLHTMYIQEFRLHTSLYYIHTGYIQSYIQVTYKSHMQHTFYIPVTYRNPHYIPVTYQWHTSYIQITVTYRLHTSYICYIWITYRLHISPVSIQSYLLLVVLLHALRVCSCPAWKSSSKISSCHLSRHRQPVGLEDAHVSLHMIHIPHTR